MENKIIEGNKNLPKHIAIIMDGNGRWASKRKLPRVAGHQEGINSVREIVRLSGEIGIKYLTLYTFSKENWQRPIIEVNALMKLLSRTIKKEINELDRNNVRLQIIGNISEIPKTTREDLLEGVEKTQNNTGLTLILALSYGSREEILNAMKQIAKEVEVGKYSSEDICEKTIINKLYTRNIPDPDLVIRTSGEFRISNFLLWQSAYAEYYITSVYWPAFRKEEYFKAIDNYLNRERRFGKISEQIK
ncbi:MAG: isoprenyl transferase [Candidatus Marinimicrobia bacterium]|jgi:undecaprenyl diphosphate synthase|nr:isoprenyl transferase [Candidatus Neomarinimicrobiota bacterium]